jgi:hypothetical protein
MKNCQGMDQTKQASLSELLALLKSLMNKGAFSPDLLDSIFGTMGGLVSAKYAAGANGSDLRSLVNQYLPYATSAALQQKAASGSGQQYVPFGSGAGSGGAALAGLLNGSTGSFFDPTRTDPVSNSLANAVPGSLVGTAKKGLGGVAVGGLEITSDEVRDYFNGVVPQDDDSFAILLWLGAGKNPMLMLETLSYAKRLHNDVILPAATYYKGVIYGDPNYPTRLGQILYGIVPGEVVTKYLRGGPPSRHLLGQAVNFMITGVQDQKVVEDIHAGRIHARYGTIARTAGVNATLPYYAANDSVVEGMLLWSDNGVPKFVGYEFK